MSAIAETPASTGSNGVNTRAFIAGGGATTALIAAAVIAFLSVAALVAFDGLPIGGGDADAGSVQVGDVPAAAGADVGAPEAAAAALGGAPGAVAATPAAATAVDPTLIPGLGLGGPNGTSPIGGDPGSDAPSVPGTGGSGSGALGGAVGGVEDTAGGVGLDLPLGDATSGLTGPFDQTVNDTLDNVGGALGNPNLGNQVDGAVNDATNGLVGPKGVVDQVLNP